MAAPARRPVPPSPSAPEPDRPFTSSPPRPLSPSRPFRTRAVLLGLALVPVLCAWSMRTEIISGGSELIERRSW